MFTMHCACSDKKVRNVVLVAAARSMYATTAFVRIGQRKVYGFVSVVDGEYVFYSKDL